MEPDVAGRITDKQMDAPTSRAVARGIGEKLSQVLGAESRCPERLRRLLDEMRLREMRAAAPDKDT